MLIPHLKSLKSFVITSCPSCPSVNKLESIAIHVNKNNVGRPLVNNKDRVNRMKQLGVYKICGKDSYVDT